MLVGVLFTLLNPVSKDMMPAYISVFDAGLVPLKKNHAYLKVIPSKIFELAAMEIPIILGVEGEAKSIVDKYSAGVTYVPDDMDSFKQKVLHLAAEKNMKEYYSSGLNSLAKDFDRGILANRMYGVFNKLVNGS